MKVSAAFEGLITFKTQKYENEVNNKIGQK